MDEIGPEPRALERSGILSNLAASKYLKALHLTELAVITLILAVTIFMVVSYILPE